MPKLKIASILKIQKKPLVITSLAVILLLAAAFPSFAAAIAPYPTPGSATVDGNPSEWDLTNDFFANMYRAGINDPNHPLQSKAYLRYDLSTQTLYVLVLTETEYPALTTGYESDAWAAIDGINNKMFTGASGNDGTPPDFAWVEIGYDGNSNHAKGYEASFSLAPGDYLIIIHIQVLSEEGDETSATTGLKAGIDLFVVPETAIATTIISVFAAGGVFLFCKKSRNSHA